MAKKKVLIANDHAAVEFKKKLIQLLPDYEWIDLGSSGAESVDYPDFSKKLTDGILSGKAEMGVLACGSGVGMSIAANKVKGIRAVLAWNPLIAELSREHNHTNVLCLGGRFFAPEYAAEIARTWIETEPSDDERHARRLKKLD